MWGCPKCRARVDDSFDVCWSCGTTPDGLEDPAFATADEAAPIVTPPAAFDPGADDPLADLAGTPWPELVDCFLASGVIEAKFVADRLIDEGIPAIADYHDINMILGGFRPELWGCGPRVRVRPKDLPRARAWVDDYEARRRAKRG